MFVRPGSVCPSVVCARLMCNPMGSPRLKAKGRWSRGDEEQRQHGAEAGGGGGGGEARGRGRGRGRRALTGGDECTVTVSQPASQPVTTLQTNPVTLEPWDALQQVLCVSSVARWCVPDGGDNTSSSQKRTGPTKRGDEDGDGPGRARCEMADGRRRQGTPATNSNGLGWAGCGPVDWWGKRRGAKGNNEDNHLPAACRNRNMAPPPPAYPYPACLPRRRTRLSY